MIQQPRSASGRRSLLTIAGVGLLICGPLAICSVVLSIVFEGGSAILQVIEAIRTLTGIDILALLPGGRNIFIPVIRDLPPLVSSTLCVVCCSFSFVAPVLGLWTLMQGSKSAGRAPNQHARRIPPPRAISRKPPAPPTRRG